MTSGTLRRRFVEQEQCGFPSTSSPSLLCLFPTGRSSETTQLSCPRLSCEEVETTLIVSILNLEVFVPFFCSESPCTPEARSQCMLGQESAQQTTRDKPCSHLTAHPLPTTSLSFSTQSHLPSTIRTLLSSISSLVSNKTIFLRCPLLVPSSSLQLHHSKGSRRRKSSQ